MTEEQQALRFCTQCGRPIPNDSDFCYACGAMAPKTPNFTNEGQGSEAHNQDNPNPEFNPGFNPGYGPYGSTVYRPTMENIVQTLVNMMMVWTVFSIIMSAIVFLMGITVIDAVYELYGQSIDPHMVIIEGSCLLFSGLTCLGASLLTKKGKRFWVAVVLCATSGVLSYFGVGGFLGVMTMVVGFYVSLGIYRCKSYFKS